MSSSARTPPLVRDALEPWCAAGLTGALRVLDAPGGAVYILDGRVEFAESPVASPPERLLTASGRIAPDTWRAAVRAGRRVGDELVASGVLSRAEWEATVLLSLYDAAHFLFDLAAGVRFEPGARPEQGAGRPLDLRPVCQEVDRRRRLLADAWPDAAIDTAAVLPQRRLPGGTVALSALQWEIVANADRRRSPIDLARLLGRDTFTVMLEVRRMTRSGLVEPGRPGGSAAAGSVATVRARAAVPPSGFPLRRVPEPPEPEPPEPAEPVAEAAAADPVGPRIPLPRRAPGTQEYPPAPAGGSAYDDSDILLRLLDGLEALR
ncbi:hypothetical protein [Hamadaea tsunoensis]|uniref:hypothetical protein n=1 Tax=Hamadaea tsunoensis TaxID=53368 RepID=UPI0004074E8B|nr:hypothetical protein [Hamadaea tsunoensis]